MLIWPRVLAKLDHPYKSEFPFLRAEDPLTWPRRFHDPWRWVGARSLHRPIFKYKGRATTAHRVLYELTIGPLQPGAYLYPDRRSDVNPLHSTLKFSYRKRDIFPPPEEYAPELVDLQDLSDWIDELAPNSLKDLEPILESEISSAQIFEALQHCNLTERLGVISAKDVISPSPRLHS